MKTRESELKFTHQSYSSPCVLRSLERACLPDGKFQANVINSIYFDTHDWLLAMEKASSDYLKTKVRLRWYGSAENQASNEMPASPCFLEFKWKIGSKREKTRIKMPFTGDETQDRIHTPEAQALFRRHIAEQVPALMGFDLAPKMLVRYTRHRYFEPLSNTRISLDTKIHAHSINQSFAQQFSKVRLPLSVLEVKGQCDELPIALRHINAIDFKKAAFSKFYECFVLLSGYEQ